MARQMALAATDVAGSEIGGPRVVPVSVVCRRLRVIGVQGVVVRGPTDEQIDPCVVYTDPQPVPVAT
jgi:hypothetical protein